MSFQYTAPCSLIVVNSPSPFLNSKILITKIILILIFHVVLNCVTVGGGWTQWSSWSSCSKTYGVGSHTRTRTCTNPAPKRGGADCVGHNKRTKKCNTTIACPGEEKSILIVGFDFKICGFKNFPSENTP